MDKSWMQLPRNLPAYIEGVDSFFRFASNHADGFGRIRCPCKKCKNREYKLVQDAYDDVLNDGIYRSYTRWIHHGEDFEVLSDDDDDDDDNSVGCDQAGIQDLFDDLQAPNNIDNLPDVSDNETSTGPNPNEYEQSSEFDKLLNDSRLPLYPGCKFSKLEFIVKLLHLKTINRLSNKAFDMNIQLIKAGYSGCIVNGVRFHTQDREARLRTQNSGVVVQGEHQSKDIEFYGVLTDIIELQYIFGKRVYLFKCVWWDLSSQKTGIQNDGYFTSVNVSKTWYKDDPFVLATQATQVFYVDDTKLRGDWKVVHKVTPRNVYDVVETREEEEAEVGNGDDAYQQEEHMVVNGIVQEEQTGDTSDNNVEIEARHEDEDVDEVDVNVVLNRGRYQMEDDFIVNEESGAEDNTLRDYFSDQEDTTSSEDDTDIA